MIIDIHTHVPPRQAWPVMLAENRRNGVFVSVLSSLGVEGWPNYPTSEIVQEANELAGEFAATAPGHILWFCYLNPQLPDWPEQLETSLAAGACGVKLWTSLRDPEGDAAACDAVARRAAAARVPVLIHTWNRTDPNLPGEFNSADFAELAKRNPDTRFVAAHAGANWRQARGLYSDLANVWVDISGGYPQRGMLEDLIQELGPDRVLYGSDALGRSLPSQLAKVEFADLPVDVKQNVLWRNAARLLGLTEADLASARQAFDALPSTSDALPLPSLAEDHFCYCGAWPFRSDLPGRAVEDLEGRLARTGCHKAYVASVEGIFAYDTMLANDRFAYAASSARRVQPLATLAPFAPNWWAQIAHAEGRFCGAIVHPYFHDWRLDDTSHASFWQTCADANLPLWVNLCTGDWRLRLRGTCPHQTTRDELLSFLDEAPPNRYVFQGASPVLITAALGASPRQDIAFEVSRLSDTTTAFSSITRRYGADRLVFGSEFPFRDLRTVRWTTEFLCGHRTANQES